MSRDTVRGIVSLAGVGGGIVAAAAGAAMLWGAGGALLVAGGMLTAVGVLLGWEA